MRVVDLDMARLRPSPKESKARMADVEALAASIKQIGIINPIQVIDTGPGKDKDGIPTYRIISGHRRWAAAKKLGLETIPAVILGTATEPHQMQAIAISENIHRKQLTPMEEAEQVGLLLTMDRTVDEIATDLGLSPRTVARRAKLLDLIAPWKKCIGEWPFEHLELIARYDEERQKELLRQYEDWVPEIDRLKEDLARGESLLRRAPWSPTDAGLLPKVGACSECTKRSSRQALLFHEEGEQVEKSDRCLDRVCWEAKLEAYIAARLEALKAKHEGLYQIQNHYGSEKPGCLTPDQFVVVQKSVKGAKPALIVAGPGMGRFVWIKLAAPERAARKKVVVKKMAERKPAEQAKVRAERLYGRRAKWVVDTLVTALREPECVTAILAKEPVEKAYLMLDLSVNLGITVSRPGSSFWPSFMEARESSDAAVEEAWWSAMRESLLQSLTVLRTTEEAARAMKGLEFIAVTILGLNLQELTTKAVVAIPNGRLKKDELDKFDPR